MYGTYSVSTMAALVEPDFATPKDTVVEIRHFERLYAGDTHDHGRLPGSSIHHHLAELEKLKVKHQSSLFGESGTHITLVKEIASA